MAPIWPNWRHRGGTESASRFQAESRVSQRGISDYVRLAGRDIQPGPLGLIDGPGVYGYSLQSPIESVGERVAFSKEESQ